MSKIRFAYMGTDAMLEIVHEVLHERGLTAYRTDRLLGLSTYGLPPALIGFYKGRSGRPFEKAALEALARYAESKGWPVDHCAACIETGPDRVVAGASYDEGIAVGLFCHKDGRFLLNRTYVRGSSFEATQGIACDFDQRIPQT